MWPVVELAGIAERPAFSAEQRALTGDRTAAPASCLQSIEPNNTAPRLRTLTEAWRLLISTLKNLLYADQN